LRDALRHQGRSFRNDAFEAVSLLPSQPRIINPQNIPAEGTALLVLNHYSRPGFDAWWIGLGISAVVPCEIHWMMTSGWRHAGVFSPITRWLFPRLAKVYGFTTAPPMPPDPREVEARVVAVRAVPQVARKTDAIIALAPEGRDQPDGILGEPPAGVGRFLYQIAKYRDRIVPIGVYEDGLFLCFNFGPSFQLEELPILPPLSLDRLVRRQVMEAISQQLPLALRGEFA
jgi:hypothetical protein